MHTPNGSIDKLHVVLPEIVLAKFSRQSFETHQRLHQLRAKRTDQTVQSRFPTSDNPLPERAEIPEMADLLSRSGSQGSISGNHPRY